MCNESNEPWKPVREGPIMTVQYVPGSVDCGFVRRFWHDDTLQLYLATA